MTAEIAILNKNAVAIAADSAVTVGHGTDQKSYYTAHKLFALSKCAPVGIMIYGSAELMETPWEIIIKSYRAKLCDKRFPSLGDYAEDFLNYLKSSQKLFPRAIQERAFISRAHGYFDLIKREFKDKASGILPADEAKFKQLIKSIIERHYDIWGAYGVIPGIPSKFDAEIRRIYSKQLRLIIKNVFQSLTLSKNDRAGLKRIASYLLTKDRFSDQNSGFVIVGFGDDEYYPSIKTYIIEMKIGKILKCKEDSEQSHSIDHSVGAVIVPFAQTRVVASFMEGIDPIYKIILDEYLNTIFQEYPKYIIEHLKALNTNEKGILNKKLGEIGKAIISDLLKKLHSFSREKMVDPIVNAVEILPKDELALMAETLVNLTSFRQKISMEKETVGGPIDVAVISKGDGFIWIKRKHYFKSELNPNFFANYHKYREPLK